MPGEELRSGSYDVNCIFHSGVLHRRFAQKSHLPPLPTCFILGKDTYSSPEGGGIRLKHIWCILFIIAVFSHGESAGNKERDVFYISRRDGFFGIYGQTHGKSTCLFNSRGVQESFPNKAIYHINYDVSGDGRFLAYSALAETGSLDIFLLDLATSFTRNLTDDIHVDSMPRFSNDGKRIVYLSHEPGGRSYDNLFFIPLDGRQRCRVTSGESRILSFVFSPDDSELLYVKYFTSRSTVISRVNLDGTGEVDLTSRFCSSRSPSLDRRGERIVYTTDCGGNFNLWIMNRDGSAKRNLYESPGYEYEPIFLEDSNRVLFFSDFIPTAVRSAGGTSIFSIGINGEGLTNLAPAALLKKEMVFSGLRYTSRGYADLQHRYPDRSDPNRGRDGGVYVFQGKRAGSGKRSYYEAYILDIGRRKLKKVARGRFDKMDPIIRIIPRSGSQRGSSEHR